MITSIASPRRRHAWWRSRCLLGCRKLGESSASAGPLGRTKYRSSGTGASTRSSRPATRTRAHDEDNLRAAWHDWVISFEVRAPCTPSGRSNAPAQRTDKGSRSAQSISSGTLPSLHHRSLEPIRLLSVPSVAQVAASRTCTRCPGRFNVCRV